MALSPTSSRASGGSYTAPITRQQLSSLGGTVTIPNGSSARLRWSHSFGPSVLLDRSTDDVPSVLTSGVYYVAASVQATLTAGGYFNVNLELDRDNEDPSLQQDSASASAANLSPVCTIGFAYYIAAGGTITVTVANRDGVSAEGFDLQAVVQRLS